MNTFVQRQDSPNPVLAQITGDDAQYALEIVKAICTEVGPGVPSSPQERARAEMIRKELASHLGEECVAVEEFTLAPGAFLGSAPLSALCMLIAALLNVAIGRLAGIPPWLTAAGALAFTLLSAVPVVLEFNLGLEFIDPFFPKKKSVNVIGTLRRPDTRSVKRLLILSGHHDSAPENTWLRLLGYGFFAFSAVWLLGLMTLLVASLVQLAGVVAGNAGMIRFGTLGWAVLALLIGPAVIYALFLTRGRRNGGNVPGAADNLSASAVAVAMCRFLVNHPADIPEDTEIRFISFGSEEAGLRGSKRYVARHLDELKRLDARLLNYEIIAHPEIAIIAAEVNRTVWNDPDMVRSVVTAAERAGVPHTVQSPLSVSVGTDAAPFSQAGLKATTLIPMQQPQQTVAFYHQKWDTPEVLTIEPLLNVLKLTLEWVRCGGE